MFPRNPMVPVCAVLPRMTALVCLFIAPVALAYAPCTSSSHDIEMAVAAAHLPQATQQKLMSQVNAAWRVALTMQDDRLQTALDTLANAKQTLDDDGAKSVPAELRARVKSAIDVFADCLRTTPAVVSVPVTVRAFTPDGARAGAGVVIRIDDQPVGQTAADGTIALQAPSGEHTFTAVASVNTGGSTSAALTAGQPGSVDVAMKGGGDFSLRPALVINETAGAILPRDFSSFTLRFRDAKSDQQGQNNDNNNNSGDDSGDDGNGGATLRLRSVLALELWSAGNMTNVVRSFTLQPGGQLVPVNREKWRALLLDKFGPYELRLRGADSKGLIYINSVRFDLGRYKATAVVTAPAGVSLDGISVRITNARDNYSFWATTTGGRAVYPGLLPEGPYLMSCEIVSGGVRYHAYNGFVLDGDKNLAVQLSSFASASAASVGTAMTYREDEAR